MHLPSINVDTALNAVGQTAKPIADTNPTWSQKLSGVAPLPTGNTSFSVSATDGAHNTQSESYQVPVNSGASKSWTYDTVGNLSFGPAEGYSFTPDNRLQFIDFFTTGSPRTYFDYDALGRCVRITVFSSFGVIASEKVYVWNGNKIIQEQDASGNVTKNYYDFGEKIGSASYFFTRDHLGSIRELTDTSGGIQAQYQYDAYGRSSRTIGSLDCDFQYAGYFYEPTSNLNLTRYRAYNPSIVRWISRDPLGGSNLYTYGYNNPALFNDPLGLEGTITICTIPGGSERGGPSSGSCGPGHSWIQWTPDDGEKSTTYSIWSSKPGVSENSDWGFYHGSHGANPLLRCYSRHIDDDQEKHMNEAIAKARKKKYDACKHNCTQFAEEVFKAATGDDFSFVAPPLPYWLWLQIDRANWPNPGYLPARL